jgi:hypothetical protein
LLQVTPVNRFPNQQSHIENPKTVEGKVNEVVPFCCFFAEEQRRAKGISHQINNQTLAPKKCCGQRLIFQKPGDVS